MAKWQDFINAIRQTNDQKRKQTAGGGFRNSIANVADVAADTARNAVHVADGAADRYFAPVASDNTGYVTPRVRDFIRELPGASVKVAAGAGNFATDTAQSVARGVAGLGKSLAETSDQRTSRLDDIKKISEADRIKLADQGDDPNNTDSRAIFMSVARRQLGGDLSDKAIDDRMKKVNGEKTTDEHVNKKNKIASFLFGSEKDEGIQTVQKRNTDIQAGLEKKGVSGPAASGLAVVGATGLSALDAPSGSLGSIIKSIGKDGVEMLAKANTDDAVRAILKTRFPSMAEDAVKTVSSKIAATTDPKEVTKALKEVGTKAYGVFAKPQDMVAGVKDTFKGGVKPGNLADIAQADAKGRPQAALQTTLEQAQGDPLARKAAEDALSAVDPALAGQVQPDARAAGQIFMDARKAGKPVTMDEARQQAAGAVPSDVATLPSTGNPGKLVTGTDPVDDDATKELLGMTKTTSQAKAELPKNNFGKRVDQQWHDKAAPLNDFVRTVEQRTGKKFATEDDAYALHRLFQGMPDAIQQDFQQVGNLLAQAPNLNSVTALGTARQIISRSERGITSNMTPERARQVIENQRNSLGAEQFDKVASIVDAISDYHKRGLDDLLSGDIISQQARDALDEFGGDYFAKMNVLSKVLTNDSNRALFAAGGSSNTTKQSISKVLKEATGQKQGTEILDPLESLYRAAESRMNLIGRNNIGKAVARMSKDAPDLVVNIRDPEDIIKSIGLKTEVKEMIPVRNEIGRVMRTQGKAVRRLATQVNQLEKKGLNASLKNGGQRMDQTPFNVAGLGGDVPTSQVGKNVSKDTNAAQIETLGRQRDQAIARAAEITKKRAPEAPQRFASEYADFLKSIDDTTSGGQMIPNGSGGYKRTSENSAFYRKYYAQNGHAPSKVEYRKEATRQLENGRAYSGFQEQYKVLKDPNYTPPVDIGDTARAKQAQIGTMISEGDSGLNSAVAASKLGAEDTNNFLQNLIENGSRSDIDKYKKMIDSRDVKTQKLLDDIGELKSKYDDTVTYLKDHRQEIDSLKDTPVPEGYELVSYFEKGVQGKVAVPSEVAEVLTGKTKAQQDIFTGIFGNVNKFVKQNFTANNPAFALITNPIRDAKSFAYNAKDVSANPLAIGKALASGFASSLKKDEMYDRWVAAGGKSGFYSNDKTAEQMVNDLKRQVSGTRNVLTLGVKVNEIKNPKDFIKAAGRIAGTPFRAIQGTASVLEDAPRLAQFKASVAANKTDATAALNARNVTVDFNQSGTAGQLANAWIPFLNPRLQGTIKSVEAIKRNPARAAAVYATLTAAPILAAAANNQRFPDVMKMIPDDTRENNFVIVLGDHKDENGDYDQVYKIPKSDIDKTLGNPLEQFARYWADDDPKSIAETVTNMLGSVAPIDVVKDGAFNSSRAIGGLLPPLLKAPVEAIANKSFYFDAPLVPQNLADLPSDEQVRADDPTTKKVERSTSFAGKLAAKIPVIGSGGSPIKAENTVRNFAGSLATENPLKTIGGKIGGSGAGKMNNEFYSTLKKTAPEKASASKQMNQAIADGDYNTARKIAQTYNDYVDQQFASFGKRYGADITTELDDVYDKQKLSTSNRAIKQRRSNIAKKSAQ